MRFATGTPEDKSGAWVVKKHNSLKKANFSRLKWFKPAKILCFFNRWIFSKMCHGGISFKYEYDGMMMICSAR